MRILQHNSSLVVHTPAKLNLRLRVLGKRDDGYHSLESLFVSIGWYDTLCFTPVDGPTVALQCRPRAHGIRSQQIPANDRNLVVRAAELLRETAGPTPGVKILLEKRIPPEAGLGGGSSDAAATLVALNRFWKLGLSSRALHDLAARLGSDVNFFLDSLPAAWGRGRGEILEPVALCSRLNFVVVQPPRGLSTGEVFAKWGVTHVRPTTAVAAGDPVPGTGGSGELGLRGEALRVLPAAPPLLAELVQNDLESTARQLDPQLGRVIEMLHRQPVIAAAMTGSGSACFALCRTWRQAQVLAGRLRSSLDAQVRAVFSAT